MTDSVASDVASAAPARDFDGRYVLEQTESGREIARKAWNKA